MSESIIGIMWAKNEADVIKEVIEDALTKVDALLFADDDSTDGTWEIVKSFGNKLEYAARREDTNKGKYPDRLWAKQHLLDEVRFRFGMKDVWVQVIESDIMILETDIREVVSKYSNFDVALDWHTLNAIRPIWTLEDDSWPNWERSIKEVLTNAHWMEIMTYTFRPLPKIDYVLDYRPWPRGFSNYITSGVRSRGKKKRSDSPLLAHYGYRSPKHMSNKYGSVRYDKNPTWDTSTPESVLKTVHFFNGAWNTGSDTFPMSRKGWNSWLTGRPL